MDAANWVTIILFGVGIIIGAYQFFYRLDKRVTVLETNCQNHTAVINTIATLNERLDKVANDNEVFWKVIGPHLENIIHSPKSVERDALVKKLTDETIERDELPVLIDLLRKALGGESWSPEKKLAGAWLLARATQLMNEPAYDRRSTRRPV